MTNRIAATLLVASALAALPWPAHAARIAAACEAPVGWRFEHGIEMPLVDDRLSASPVIVWEEGASEALVILETGISEAASLLIGVEYCPRIGGDRRPKLPPHGLFP